jgi:hypothetical protein
VDWGQLRYAVASHILKVGLGQLAPGLLRQWAVERHHGIHSLLSPLATGEVGIVQQVI